jgi:hypothetical protein
MMLTKKGSTRGTVSFLFLSALVFLSARFVVVTIEAAMPDKSIKTVAWKPVPDVLKDGKVALSSDDREALVELGLTKKAGVKEETNTDAAKNEFDPSKERKAVNSDPGDTKLKSNLNEPASTLEPLKSAATLTEKGQSAPEDSKASPAEAKIKTQTEKKKARKRFEVERIFEDNKDQLPLFIFFADDASAISKKMENTSLAIKDVREKIEKEYYPVKIHFDKPLTKTEYRLYREYGSTAVPMVSIRTSTGEQLAYGSGYLSAVKLIVLLKNAKKKEHQLEENQVK